MKKYLSGLITGIVLTTLVGGLVVGASAISSKMTIEVDPINVQVNGEVFQPKDVNGNDVPVFVYNGTTYAPLRALAEAYGLEVGYDAASNMATVVDPEAKPVDTPTPDTTAKGDYSDWSAEDEAAYQEFKGMWKVECVYESFDDPIEGRNGVMYEGVFASNNDISSYWKSINKNTLEEHMARWIYELVNEQPEYTHKYSARLTLKTNLQNEALELAQMFYGDGKVGGLQMYDIP